MPCWVKQAFAFVAMHWRWVLGAGSMGLAYLGAFINRPNAARRLQVERDAEDVRRKVAEIAAERGAAAAHASVRETYAAEMDKLDDKQQEQATSLAADPDALAAFLVRATGTPRKPT